MLRLCRLLPPRRRPSTALQVAARSLEQGREAVRICWPAPQLAQVQGASRTHPTQHACQPSPAARQWHLWEPILEVAQLPLIPLPILP